MIMDHGIRLTRDVHQKINRLLTYRATGNFLYCTEYIILDHKNGFKILIEKKMRNFNIYNSSVGMYDTEFRLNSWTDFDEIVFVFEFLSGLDLQSNLVDCTAIEF
jgi:hypothetical protein